MSAFICSDYHISVLADYGTRPRRNHHGLWADGRYWTARDAVFQALFAENVRSVLYRYPDDTLDSAPGPIGPKGSFDHRAVNRVSDPVTIIKLCHCLEYQSCEAPDHKETVAFQLLQAIEAEAVRSLPGYDKAPWGIDAPCVAR